MFDAGAIKLSGIALVPSGKVTFSGSRWSGGGGVVSMSDVNFYIHFTPNSVSFLPFLYNIKIVMIW